MPRKPSQTVGRGASPQERAVLVGLHLTGRTAKQGRQAMLARQAALLAADGPAAGPHADAQLFAPDDDFVEELAEFRELVTSAGAAIEAEIVQRRERPDAATLIGPGKVEEVAAVAASSEADLVIFGRDLSPSQLRNLEASLPCRVIDRTQLILDIFARHARTREGQLQVELAQLEYLLPRLAGRGKAMSQLGGGIGTRGPGETKLETDRRQIRKRIDHIKAQVEAVRRTRQQQRQRREAVPVPTVALVGYTNAGKSTLFNALTKLAGASDRQAEVLESARMFATLDPKLRAITLPSRRKVLLADTVGFVRDLPHTLITSFRATLEEAATAEVLLHVRDASSSTLDRQKEDVETVLAELEITGKPVIQVLNKSDLLLSPQESGALARREAGLAVSALKHTGLAELLEAVESAMQADPMQSCWLRVPQAEGGVLAALEAGAQTFKRVFEADSVLLYATGPASLMGRYRRFVAEGVPSKSSSREANKLNGPKRKAWVECPKALQPEGP